MILFYREAPQQIMLMFEETVEVPQDVDQGGGCIPRAVLVSRICFLPRGDDPDETPMRV